MKFKDLNLEYKGFKPSQDLKNHIDGLTKEIFYESPSQSFLKASFEREDDLFKGIIKIQSSVGNFFAAASGEQVKDVCANLITAIRQKLNEWKKVRFLDGN